MALDLVFFVILAVMVALGAWRGLVATLAGFVALMAGYAGAVVAASTLSGPLGSALAVPALVAPAVAGTLGFAVAWLFASAAGDVAVAWDRERVDGGQRGIVDRVAGGAIGFARGGLVVVLLALLSSWVDAARDLGAVAGLEAMPDAGASTAVAASGALVETVVANAFADAGPAGQVAARITAHPAETLASVQSLLEDPRLTQLFSDRLFWTLITNDSVDYAMNREAMRAVVEDAQMRARFADLGLVDAAAKDDPERFRATMAGVLAEVAPKVHQLQHDPELEALAQDPEIVGLIEAGDVVGLAGHPSIRKLVARVSAR